MKKLKTFVQEYKDILAIRQTHITSRFNKSAIYNTLFLFTLMTGTSILVGEFITKMENLSYVVYITSTIILGSFVIYKWLYEITYQLDTKTKYSIWGIIIFESLPVLLILLLSTSILLFLLYGLIASTIDIILVLVFSIFILLIVTGFTFNFKIYTRAVFGKILLNTIFVTLLFVSIQVLLPIRNIQYSYIITSFIIYFIFIVKTVNQFENKKATGYPLFIIFLLVFSTKELDENSLESIFRLFNEDYLSADLNQIDTYIPDIEDIEDIDRLTFSKKGNGFTFVSYNKELSKLVQTVTDLDFNPLYSTEYGNSKNYVTRDGEFMIFTETIYAEDETDTECDIYYKSSDGINLEEISNVCHSGDFFTRYLDETSLYMGKYRITSEYSIYNMISKETTTVTAKEKGNQILHQTENEVYFSLENNIYYFYEGTTNSYIINLEDEVTIYARYSNGYIMYWISDNENQTYNESYNYLITLEDFVNKDFHQETQIRYNIMSFSKHDSGFISLYRDNETKISFFDNQGAILDTYPIELPFRSSSIPVIQDDKVLIAENDRIIIAPLDEPINYFVNNDYPEYSKLVSILYILFSIGVIMPLSAKKGGVSRGL